MVERTGYHPPVQPSFKVEPARRTKTDKSNYRVETGIQAGPYSARGSQDRKRDGENVRIRSRYLHLDRLTSWHAESSMALTEMGDPYCICAQDERIQKQVRGNFVISCGACPSVSCASLKTSILIAPLSPLRRERAKDLMPPGQESLVIIVDYKSTTLRTNPSISVARKVGILSVEECIANQRRLRSLPSYSSTT